MSRNKANLLPKVLVVGPEPNCRGGISTVIREHSLTAMWGNHGCELLTTYVDGNPITKIFVTIKAWVLSPFKMSGKRIVHCHMSGGASFYRKAVIALVAKLLRKITIVHLHISDTSWFRTNKLVARASGFLFQRTDCVITVSKSMAEDIGSFCHMSKIRIIPNPCPNEFLEMLRDDSGKSTVLFAGRIGNRKGSFDLIAAFSKVAKAVPQARLVMAGDGDIQRGKELALSLGISGSISFPGWLCGKSKADAFRNADVFCLPSYREGLPLAILEAMACGLPVVSTPVNGISELIMQRKNGILVQPGDVHGLANVLAELLTDQDLRIKLGTAARKYVAEEFSREVVSSLLSSLYSELVQPR